jgi:hypothetical protein
VQAAADAAALRGGLQTLAGLYVRGLLAGATICVLLSELAVRARLVRVHQYLLPRALVTCARVPQTCAVWRDQQLTYDCSRCWCASAPWFGPAAGSHRAGLHSWPSRPSGPQQACLGQRDARQTCVNQPLFTLKSSAALAGMPPLYPAGPAAQGAANAVHARELLAVALAALLG